MKPINKTRCNYAWCMKPGVYQDYHDTEWGTPVHDDRKHYEMLTLEAMSCGLSFV